MPRQRHTRVPKTVAAENRELKLQVEALQQIFRSGRYAISSTEELKSALEASFLLRDVTSGQKAARELLTAIEVGCRPDVVDAMVIDLAEYLAPRLEQFARGLAAKTDKTAMAPALGLLVSLRELQTACPLYEKRKETITALMVKIRELCDRAAITDKDEIGSLIDAVSRRVGREPALVVAIESGDFEPVENLFSECLRRRPEAALPN